MNDRRDELQQNELAHGLGKLNTAIEPYSKPIAVVAAVAIIGLIAYSLFRSETQAKVSQSTLALINTVDTGDSAAIEKIYDANPNSVTGGWASVFAADAMLAAGINDLFLDRETGIDQIESAAKAYERATAISGDNILTSRAHLGIARAAEAVGDIDRAVKAYEAVIPVAESDAVRQLAEDRIKVLGRDETADFYAWFNTQDFGPSDPSLPPGLPGASSLSTTPDFELPDLDLGDEDLGDDATGEAGEPDEDAPMTESADVVEETTGAATEEPSTEEPPTEPTDEPSTESTEEPAAEANASDDD